MQLLYNYFYSIPFSLHCIPLVWCSRLKSRLKGREKDGSGVIELYLQNPVLDKIYSDHSGPEYCYFVIAKYRLFIDNVEELLDCNRTT